MAPIRILAAADAPRSALSHIAHASGAGHVSGEAVAAFNRWLSKDHYPVLMLDGGVLSRKDRPARATPPGVTALGLHPEGRKEIIDYRLATTETAPTLTAARLSVKNDWR